MSDSATKSWTRGQTRSAILILLIAFSARGLIAFDWHRKALATIGTGNPSSVQPSPDVDATPLPFRLGDSHSYWTLAQQIAAGREYQYGSENAKIFRAPLYPIFLVPFTTLTNSDTAVLAARLAGCGLGTLAVGLLMRLALRIADPASALATGLLAALHPGAVGASVTILAEALVYPLMVGHLLLLTRALKNKPLHPDTRHNHGSRAFRDAFGSGVLAALAILARPSWLLFIPFATCVGFIVIRQRWQVLKISCVSLLAVCAVMTPWWIRNAIITGHFVPTTLQVGLSLYDGLHEGATGASDEGMAFSMKLQDEQRRFDAESTRRGNALTGTLEYRVDQLAKQRALQWASDNPGTVLALAGQKFLRTWSLWPNGGEVGSTTVRIAISLGTFGILLLAVYGTCTRGRPKRNKKTLSNPNSSESETAKLQDSIASKSENRAFGVDQVEMQSNRMRLIGLCWMPCIYFTLLHMVFVGSIRYREPGVFVLCVVAGIGLSALLGRFLGQAAPDDQAADAPPTA